MNNKLILAALGALGVYLYFNKASASEYTVQPNSSGDPDDPSFVGPPAPTLAEQSGMRLTKYKVKPGDTLAAISQALYTGKDTDFGKIDDRQALNWFWVIYDLNRDVIGGNPDRLNIGTVLMVPDARDLPFNDGPNYFARAQSYFKLYNSTQGHIDWNSGAAQAILNPSLNT